MKFWEAMKALEEDKKVTFSPDHGYSIILFSIDTGYSLIELIGFEWEIYQEPDRRHDEVLGSHESS